jgi:hypothetical protein
MDFLVVKELDQSQRPQNMQIAKKPVFKFDEAVK